ncbi:hypothetical protein OZ410_02095 [Robiginitalea sp. M366]|uniref:hypothetical protein n=1 Tax=Robiginitalea aestuariiviva TaxID=3036903 RepID=UPI00240E7564|nr:hypothetical protein [Robiginitalea aestuariiviva]MDG1571090.1 hypothetical protein [Robiginitalea aestuariiviva]
MKSKNSLPGFVRSQRLMDSKDLQISQLFYQTETFKLVQRFGDSMSMMFKLIISLLVVCCLLITLIIALLLQLT